LKQLREQFQSITLDKYYRELIITMHQKQEENTSDYYYRFCNVANKLKQPMDDESMKLCFWKGLKSWIKKKVDLNPSTSLEELHLKSKVVEEQSEMVNFDNYSKNKFEKKKYKTPKFRSQPHCNYCNKDGHVEEKCYIKKFNDGKEAQSQQRKFKSSKPTNISTTNTALYFYGTVNNSNCKVIIDTGSAHIMVQLLLQQIINHLKLLELVNVLLLLKKTTIFY